MLRNSVLIYNWFQKLYITVREILDKHFCDPGYCKPLVVHANVLNIQYVDSDDTKINHIRKLYSLYVLYIHITQYV